MIREEQDKHFMKEALKEAMLALAKDEVPVGAIITCNHKIIARAYNLSERLTDPTAHAEMQALTSACHHLNSKYLRECTLYITLEPCPMCAGATFWTQLGRMVFGAPDPKRGFTLYNEMFPPHGGNKKGGNNALESRGILHPKTKVTAGVLKTECSALLSNYFKVKRKTEKYK